MEYHVKRATVSPELAGLWDGSAWGQAEAITVGNFRPEMQLLRDADAIIEAPDEAALTAALGRLLSDPQAARLLGERARATVSQSRGATGRTLDELERVLAEALPP